MKRKGIIAAGALALLVLALFVALRPAPMSAADKERADNMRRMVEEMQTRMSPPEAYLRASDRERARRHEYDRVCLKVERDYYSELLPIDQCVRMTPSRRFRGIWIDAFEGSRFYPGATSRPAAADDVSGEDGARNGIWLNVDRIHLPHGYETGGRNGRAVLVDFTGRQTVFPGAYGQFGMFAHEIIVDWVISAKPLD